MSDKEIVFITGANQGIGFEVVKALLQSPKPYHIFLGSRSLSRGQEAIAKLEDTIKQSPQSAVELVEIDVTVDDQIYKSAELVQTKFGKLDVLINNAGTAFDRKFADDAADFRGLFNKTFDVNVSGAQVTTAAFAPLLVKSQNPRLLFLASGTATLSGNEKAFVPPWMAAIPAGWPKENVVLGMAYRTAKTGLNMMMLTWHWVLKPDGVKTWAVSPGFLATNLTGDPEGLKKAGGGDPSLGGDLIKRVVEGERDEDVGRVVTQNGVVQPW